MENTLRTKKWKTALKLAFCQNLKLLEIVHQSNAYRQSIDSTCATETKKPEKKEVKKL